MVSNQTLSDEQLRRLVEQTDELDKEVLLASLTAVAQDINDQMKHDPAAGSPIFQSIYDSVANEERIIRADRSPDFEPAGEVDLPEGYALTVAEGRTGFDALARETSMDERAPETGRKLLDRIMTSCRKRVCETEDIFALNGPELTVALSTVIAGALAGPMAPVMFAGVAVIVATFIVQVGLDVYCERV